MDELLGLYGEAVQCVNLLLDEILHSLHVVVGNLLDILHALGILLCEVAIDVAQGLKEVVVYHLQLGQWQFTKGNEILDFYAHTIAYQCILRKVSC